MLTDVEHPPETIAQREAYARRGLCPGCGHIHASNPWKGYECLNRTAGCQCLEVEFWRLRYGAGAIHQRPSWWRRLRAWWRRPSRATHL